MKRQLKGSEVFNGQIEIQVIPPIIQEAFLKPPTRADARQRLGLEAGRFVIALGARSVTDTFKGIPQFLAELAKHEELAAKLVILLFGEGNIPVPDSIQVRSFGAIHQPEELATIFAAANVFVSPSKMETFGMTLVEAQASGTPVLCFSVGGTPEALLAGETGWLFPNGDFPAIIEHIRLLISDMPRCDAFGINARKWAANSFCALAVARQQETIYKTGSN
jgi:glycosyltransferase involved in cell wall biosynthesis